MKQLLGELEKLNTKELIESYSKIITLLKDRGIIRSKNLIGDLGEYLVISHYNNTAGLPNMQAAPQGTQNIDAISRKGDRYSIKSTSGKLTGVFYGLNSPDSSIKESKKFEYVVIAVFNDHFKLDKILELDWDLFLSLKKWHKTMRAWNLSINKVLVEKSKIVYERK